MAIAFRGQMRSPMRARFAQRLVLYFSDAGCHPYFVFDRLPADESKLDVIFFDYSLVVFLGNLEAPEKNNNFFLVPALPQTKWSGMPPLRRKDCD